MLIHYIWNPWNSDLHGGKKSNFDLQEKTIYTKKTKIRSNDNIFISDQF